MSLFFGINIAAKGMSAQQAAIDVAAHNIANANTDGYSRQRVELEANQPIPGIINAGHLGSGVDIAAVTRVRDEFLDYQVRKESSSMEKQKSIYESLELVEIIFMEPSDTGFNAKLDEFWNSWQELSRTPESSPVRTALKESSISLTDALRQIHSQLTDLKRDIDNQIELNIIDINSLSERIAHLNEQIVNAKMTGQSPNDLYDKRDLVLDQLAAIGNMAVKNCVDENGKATGAIEVKFGGITIVDGGDYRTIANADIDSSFVIDGRLAGLLQIGGANLQTNSIQYYISGLDTIAAGIAKSINDIHRTGTDLNGITGQDYFVFRNASGDTIDLDALDWNDPYASGLSAANIFANPEVEGDVSCIAAAFEDGISLEGNGDAALKIAQFRDAYLSYDPVNKVLEENEKGNITIGMFYHNMITELGSAANEAEKRVVNQQALVNQTANRRESLQGVIIDEEVANMVMFQHSFDASAKVISIIDQMLDTIINRLKA